MSYEFCKPASQLAAVMKRIYKNGMTTTSGGNLSIKDDNGNVWITPAGIDKSRLEPEDIVCVKADGTVEGIHKPSSELPFHQMIYEKRPDLKAVLHAHPPALVAFSIVGKVPDTNLTPGVNKVCGRVGIAGYVLPASIRLGERIAGVFEQGINSVIMENHGVVIGGTSLIDGFKALEMLDFCARLQINASHIGKIKYLDEESANINEDFILPEFVPGGYSSLEKDMRGQMCDLLYRAYDMKLITCTQGDFSQRLTGNDFLVTPHLSDIKNIRPDDLVKVQNRKMEAGKIPSRSVKLHQYIYERNPDINSIIIAQPLNAMAFTVTDSKFDSRIIPESYILLRDIPRIPFGSFRDNSKYITSLLSPKTPVIMVKNKCIVVTGNNLLNAYDRLEVLEYSAQSIIASNSIGTVSSISDKDIENIEEAFGLEK